MDDIISVQQEGKKDVQGESGVNLSIFEPIIRLSRISMLNSPSMSLTEIKEEGKSERWRVADRHMFGPVSPLNVIWHMVLCASSGVEFLLSG